MNTNTNDPATTGPANTDEYTLDLHRWTNTPSDLGEGPKTSAPLGDTGPSGKSVITGINGFLGSHLAERLVGDGQQILGLDSAPYPRAQSALGERKGTAPNLGYMFERCDLATDDLTTALAGVDTVYHLAGVSGVRESWGHRYADYVHANILGTQRLLEACRENGVRRVIIASSSSIYGSASRPSRADDLPRPLSPYGVSKLATEQLALAYATDRASDFDVCVLRYFTVYGPRQRPTMLMSQILKAAHTGHPVTVFGNGSHRRHFTYVDDAVEATVLAGSRPLTGSHVVNVAGPRSVSVSEVLATTENVLGVSVPVRYQGDRAGDVNVSEADLDGAFELLGYRPRVDLAEGLARHGKWYRASASAGPHAFVTAAGGGR